jgi:hypothetical protein
VISLITIKIEKDIVHVLMFENSPQNPCILRRRKIKYIAKPVTDTVLIKIASIITMMSARKFINAKLVRLN